MQPQPWCQSRLGKINVTIDMPSVMGGLSQNLGAGPYARRCAKILAHNEERNLGT